jgi:hypothetical protein
MEVVITVVGCEEFEILGEVSKLLSLLSLECI